MKTFVLIFIMAATTYLVRMIPFTVFRRKITNPFLRSLLAYLPYAIISAMTFPAVLYVTGDLPSSVAGLAAGLLLGLLDRSLVEISLAATAVSLAVWLIRK